MASSDFGSARFGLFVAFVGLLGVGYYAYSLRAETLSQKEVVAKYVSENSQLQANLAKLDKDNGVTVEALAACNKTVAETEAKLSELSKNKPTTRKK